MRSFHVRSTTRGYGYTIQVVDGNATLYEETATSCIVNPFLLMGSLGIELVEPDSVAHMSVYRFVPYFVLDKSDSFQAACTDGPDLVIGDNDYTWNALQIFDVLNQTFMEHFMHFDDRIGGIDEWMRQAQEARDTLASNSTDEELVSAFQSMLLPLDNYHTWVMDGNGNFVVVSHDFLWEFKEEFAQQAIIDEWDTYKGEKTIMPWRNNAASYLQNELIVDRPRQKRGQDKQLELTSEVTVTQLE